MLPAPALPNVQQDRDTAAPPQTEPGERRDRGTQTPECSTGLRLTQPRPSTNTVALSVVFPGIWPEQRQIDFTRIKPTEKNLALDVSELLFNPETAQLSEFGI